MKLLLERPGFRIAIGLVAPILVPDLVAVAGDGGRCAFGRLRAAAVDRRCVHRAGVRGGLFRT
jgi:hypothetical protein